jgi:uncharacterized protein (TIGR00369 family)
MVGGSVRPVGREAERCKRTRKCMDEGGFFAKIVKGDLPQAPITRLLGWKFLEFDASQQVIKVEMQARPEFINPVGFIHGGMLAAMLDETLSPALAATLGPGEFAPTLEIKVNFITPAKVRSSAGYGSGRESRPFNLRLGGAHDEHGNLLAIAMATSKIGRQS